MSQVISSTILQILKEMKDEELMKDKLSNMNVNDISNLFYALDRLDEETQSRWLEAYRKLTTYKL